MMSTKTIALIGASGFIGRRISRALSSEGHRVISVVRSSSKLQLEPQPGARICRCSLSAKDQELRDALAESDAVIYAAGAVRGNQIEDFRPANVLGVESVADILKAAQNTPLLLLSSLAASAPHLSDYARSKREGETVLANYPEIPSTIFRPPAVYGPGDVEMRPLFDWMRKGITLRMGPASQRLSLLYVDDLAKAVITWMSSDPESSQDCFELHDGRVGGYSLEEIADTVAPEKSMRVITLPKTALTMTAKLNSKLAGLTGRRPMLSPGKVRELTHDEWICDNTAITKAIGWAPEFPLQNGIQQLYKPSET